VPRVNGYDVELEAEHRDLIEAGREAEAWAGVICSRGCAGPEPCEHVAHLVAAIKAGRAR